MKCTWQNHKSICCNSFLTFFLTNCESDQGSLNSYFSNYTNSYSSNLCLSFSFHKHRSVWSYLIFFLFLPIGTLFLFSLLVFLVCMLPIFIIKHWVWLCSVQMFRNRVIMLKENISVACDVFSWFFLSKPGFLEFIWIFSGKNHFKINVSHI